MSGREALDFLKNCDAWPDIILLDCMMPGLSGYEVITQLRREFPMVRPVAHDVQSAALRDVVSRFLGSWQLAVRAIAAGNICELLRSVASSALGGRLLTLLCRCRRLQRARRCSMPCPFAVWSPSVAGAANACMLAPLCPIGIASAQRPVLPANPKSWHHPPAISAHDCQLPPCFASHPAGAHPHHHGQRPHGRGTHRAGPGPGGGRLPQVRGMQGGALAWWAGLSVTCYLPMGS